ncbi:hypothetical protein [Novosphingobium sp. BL-52-GroH]|uniref:hypothetical protein n=1 Tax=Novosphingobium sp. BL-52-GroH TaxID=3349877 RepID=UPI00384B23CA
MKLRNTLLSLTATAMLVAPVAAQAGTTAAASTGKIASLAGMGERKSAGVKARNKADAGVVVLAVAALGAGTYGVVNAVEDNKSNGS